MFSRHACCSKADVVLTATVYGWSDRMHPCLQHSGMWRWKLWGYQWRLIEQQICACKVFPNSPPGPKAQRFPRVTPPTCQAQMTWIPCWKALQSSSRMEPGPCPANRGQLKIESTGSHYSLSYATFWPRKKIHTCTTHLSFLGMC